GSHLYTLWRLAVERRLFWWWWIHHLELCPSASSLSRVRARSEKGVGVGDCGSLCIFHYCSRTDSLVLRILHLVAATRSRFFDCVHYLCLFAHIFGYRWKHFWSGRLGDISICTATQPSCPLDREHQPEPH